MFKRIWNWLWYWVLDPSPLTDKGEFIRTFHRGEEAGARASGKAGVKLTRIMQQLQSKKKSKR